MSEAATEPVSEAAEPVSEAATEPARKPLAGGDGVLITWRESPRAVKALLAGVFVNKLGGFVQVFLVLFMTERGFAAVPAGVALGAYGAGSVVGAVFGGWISDRIGPRLAIAGSMIATSGLLVAVLYVRPYPALLMVVTLVGGVSQVYRPASAALLAELTPRRRQVMQYVSTLPLAIRAGGLEPFWYSVMVSLNGFVVITCELLMTKVASRWPARRVLSVGFTLLGAGLACYALPGGVPIFVAGTLIWSLAEIIEGPTMFAYPAQAGPPHLRGRYIGAAHGMFGLGSALGPVLGVALWSGMGNALWIICGAASVLALLPGWYGINPRLARD